MNAILIYFREHAAELNNPVLTTPLLFMKPPSCYLLNGGAIEVKIKAILVNSYQAGFKSKGPQRAISTDYLMIYIF